MRLLRKFYTGQFLQDPKKGRLALVLESSTFSIMRIRWLSPDKEEAYQLEPGTRKGEQLLGRLRRFKPVDLASYTISKECPTRVVKVVRTLDTWDVLLESLVLPPNGKEPDLNALALYIIGELKLKSLHTETSMRKVGNFRRILIRIYP